MSQQLAPILKRFDRRLRLRDGWILLQKTAWIALLAALIIQLVGRYQPIERLWLWTLVPLLIWLLAVPLWSLLKRTTALKIAQRIDSELALKERLSTAIHFQQSEHEPSELISRQQVDALNTIQAINPAHSLPLLWEKRPLLLAAAMILPLSALLLLPNPMEQILADRAAVARAIEKEADQIEALQESVEESQALSAEDRQKLLADLAELADQLSADPQDREDALARLSEMEETLRRQLDPDRFAQQEMLAQLAAQLQALANAEQGGTDPALDESLDALDQLADQLENMDPMEQAELAQSLAQAAANAAQAGDGSLAQALAAMSQAAQSGNAAALDQAAANAATALAQSNQVAGEQGELQEAMDQLQQSRDAIAQAGQGRQQAQGPGQGQGQGQGEGQGQGQGQAGQGGGTTADQLPAAQRQGTGNLLEGNDQGSMMGDMGEQVYVPWDRRPETGEESFIAGQETGQGETQIRQQRNPLPGLDSSTLIPYQEVYADYANTASQTIDRSTIPPGLRDYVRDYFVQLEP